MRRTDTSLSHFLRPHAPYATHARLLAACLLAAATFTTASAAGAAGSGSRSAEPMLDTSGNYRGEVRACREGRTAEDRPTCLREARNAEADRKRGRLTNQGNFEANALARCSAFKQAQDKEACRARIVGHVEIQGSVAGGGILRQVAITEPTPASAQQPPSNAMGANPPPSTAAPMDDLGEADELLPEEQDLRPGEGEGETLEDQPAGTVPGP